MYINACSFGNDYQDIVVQMVESRLSDSEILQSLKDNYQVKIHLRTLQRRKADWGLIHHAAQQVDSLEEVIRHYFKNDLTYAQIYHAISTTHQYTHSRRNLERKLKSMQLSRRLDDLDRNLTTVETAVSCIMDLHQTTEGRNAGYKKIQQLLQRQYGISLHTMTVALINRTLDPEGVENRAKRVLKRRVFNTPGPNFIWSADGHDKLKKFGITLYGFIDAWSRKILGIFVHVTNNDPRHVGFYYLQLCHDPSQAHLFTKSTHNQKIECLWSQLMKGYNCELINKLFKAMEEGYYNPEDLLEQLLFLHLWVPFLQNSLDQLTGDYNNYKRRIDKKSILPTGCSAD
ncbi:hypothetical protein PTTG_00796 [Puccinia triticina 1-1 BBBD Race 1]|uniref:Integrase core domain-containing protein n=1 Tax=Puccinia triticina (isolate 1-1 / race 1 (BBBD)) TaxID=630390 RepID=A0A0C4EJ79_PUCT1|nr:hypothetical protein PTTG_00796 [Puccinia triticina 1-1 BBBD Race 1]